MIHVYPYAKDKNKDEIKRGFEELGLWGIAVVSSYQNMTIDSPLMDPIYEMAIKYHMPVYIHPTIRIRLWGGERYDLFMKLTREYDIAKSFVEFIYGVLPRFPELTAIFAHFGGGLPALKGRLLAWHQSKNIPLPEEDRGHGFAVDPESLPEDCTISYTNANDGTVEGFEVRSLEISCVQFHPEAHGGPRDTEMHFFDDMFRRIP
jgi:hypothetical protein